MHNYVRVTEDVWVNPDKVELVFLERVNREGVVHEEPFVVIGFAGGGGRALEPTYGAEAVVNCLDNRVDWTPPVPVLSENQSVVNNNFVYEADRLSLKDRVLRRGAQ